MKTAKAEITFWLLGVTAVVLATWQFALMVTG
jgi:hypothetical protein